MGLISRVSSRTYRFKMTILTKIPTCGLLLTILIWNSAKFNSSLYSYHPITMSLAYLILIPFIVNLLQDKSEHLNYQTSVLLHTIIGSVIVLLNIAGFYAIYQSREDAGKIHFKSWHSYFGTLTIISLLVSTGIFGIPGRYLFLTKFIAKFTNWQPVILQLKLKNIHRWFIIPTCLFATLTLVTSTSFKTVQIGILDKLTENMPTFRPILEWLIIAIILSQYTFLIYKFLYKKYSNIHAYESIPEEIEG